MKYQITVLFRLGEIGMNELENNCPDCVEGRLCPECDYLKQRRDEMEKLLNENHI